MTKCFYLESVGAKGNARFWALSRAVDKWKHPESHLFWSANAIAYQCHNSKKRNMVYKREKRALTDLWWDVFEQTGLRLNGLHLGQLYLDQRQERKS